MMIIQDEQRLKEEESIMIGDDNFTGKDEEITDFSLTNNSLLKSANRRKQIKPNRVTTDDEQQPTDLSNGHQSPSESYSKKNGESNLVSPSSFIENINFPSPLSINEQPVPLITTSQQSTIPTKINEKSSEDYCEICQKHFCNKYYLRKHKGECHGVYTDYIKSLQKSSNENPVKTSSNRLSSSSSSSSSSIQIPTNTLLLNPFYPGPSDIKSLFPIPSSSSPSTLSIPSPKSSPQRTIRRCHICQQEFRNRALFRMHMNTFHPNEKAKKLSSISSSTTNLGFLPPFVDTSSQLAQKIVTGQTPQTSYGIVNDSYFSAKMADRVVCEICNKQVCNKYFLKTHKAKVHGITSNDSTPEQINDNLDNAEAYCSICKKDFSTKYFYLFHMQTVHNDTSDPAYQTLLQFMKTAASMNENANPYFSFPNSEQFDDESDGNTENFKRKRTSSQSSNEKRFTEANAGLQPFLLESEDPKFSHTFVPCMVYLPVIRRVTQQVKVNLRLKPVLAESSS